MGATVGQMEGRSEARGHGVVDNWIRVNLIGWG